jgi:hypothetical protein
MALDFSDLSVDEKELWGVGDSLTADSLTDARSDLRLVAMSYGSLHYLFVRHNKLPIKPESLYSKHSEVGLEPVFQTTSWRAHNTEFGQYDIGFGLFLIKGFSSSDQFIRATLENIRHEVIVVNLGEKPKIEIANQMKFEALLGFSDISGAKVKKFFRERRIVSGTYFIASINNFVLSAILNPLAVKAFLETESVPEGYFQSHYYGLDVYCPNVLYYIAEQEHFKFRVNLNLDPNSNEAELMATIKSVLDSTFGSVETYVKAEGDDSIFQEIFNCSADESDKIWEAFHFWHSGDDDENVEEEKWETVANWVRPDIVDVLMVSSEIDPSRGTPIWNSTKIDEYSETFNEWLNTNFEKVHPGPYLLRLEEQNREIKKAAASINKAYYLDLPLEELDFSVRTYNCLKREGINTLGEVIALSELDLQGIKNLGSKGIVEIPERISAMGLGHLVGRGSWPLEEK